MGELGARGCSLLGAGLLETELHECIVDVARGASGQTSAFLSAW